MLKGFGVSGFRVLGFRVLGFWGLGVTVGALLTRRGFWAPLLYSISVMSVIRNPNNNFGITS